MLGWSTKLGHGYLLMCLLLMNGLCSWKQVLKILENFKWILKQKTHSLQYKVLDTINFRSSVRRTTVTISYSYPLFDPCWEAVTKIPAIQKWCHAGKSLNSSIINTNLERRTIQCKKRIWNSCVWSGTVLQSWPPFFLIFNLISYCSFGVQTCHQWFNDFE